MARSVGRSGILAGTVNGERMCTTGVLRIGEGDYLLFKNKDFRRSRFEDRLVLESNVFGVEGAATWAGSNPDLDRFSGFSIGANDSGLLCSDTNVRTLEGHANYDDLVEAALRYGTDVESGAAAVREATRRSSYSWANLLLIDATSQAVVEVRGHDVDVRFLDAPVACTNHQVIFPAMVDVDDMSTSVHRLSAAYHRLGTATTIGDILALQSSHDDGHTGICNHSANQTVYSYVLRHRHERTELSVIQGKPCVAGEPDMFVLPLGSTWSQRAADSFRSTYPSRHTQASRACVDSPYLAGSNAERT